MQHEQTWTLNGCDQTLHRGVNEELVWGSVGLRRRRGDTAKESDEESGLRPRFCPPAGPVIEPLSNRAVSEESESHSGTPGCLGTEPGTPGCLGTQSGTPGSLGTQSGTPGCPGTQSGTPGSPGRESMTPGGPGRESRTPGAPGTESGTPGGPGTESGTPGGLGTESETPGSPRTESGGFGFRVYGFLLLPPDRWRGGSAASEGGGPS